MPFKLEPAKPLENVFLELIQSGKQSVGYWGGQLTEDFGVVARNFPYVLLDREHNNMPMDFVTQARDAMRAAGSNSTLIVRVREPEAREAQGVLDSGAQVVMFPMINMAEQAEHAVALCNYPPQGIRGMG
jgi:4-hydroxy-2-oxoheptanedioate aldolase